MSDERAVMSTRITLALASVRRSQPAMIQTRSGLFFMILSGHDAGRDQHRENIAAESHSESKSCSGVDSRTLNLQLSTSRPRACYKDPAILYPLEIFGVRQ